MAIGIAIGVLAEVLLPGGAAAGEAHKCGGNGKPENMKEWLRNKLKPLVRLLGRLGVNAAETLPGIWGDHQLDPQ